MKLEIFLVLATLCVLISARPKERIWGDTHRPELGREMVHKVKTEGEKYTTYTFTYPRVREQFTSSNIIFNNNV